PCCGEPVVRRATETIPKSFANLHVHVHIRHSGATSARRLALYRPSARLRRLMEPSARRLHNRGLPELVLWIVPRPEPADQPGFVMQLRLLQLPELRSLISSTLVSESPARLRRLLVPLVPCAHAAF